MKKKLILILALIMCLSLAACSNGDAGSETSAKNVETKDEENFLIGIANFDENPDWIKTDDSDHIVYTNGGESAITVSYSMGQNDFQNLPNHALRQAQQDNLEITRNEEAKVNGYNAKYLDYIYEDNLLGYREYLKTRTVYIEDYNGVYTFLFQDVGDETFTDEDFDKMVESIEIDM